MTSSKLTELTDEEREALVLELRTVWLSRRMFGFLLSPEVAPYYIEPRTFPEFLEAHGVS